MERVIRKQNEERAERAARVVLPYASKMGESYKDQTTVQDLLTDLMHYIRQMGWDYEEVRNMAEVNFEAEVEEEENEDLADLAEAE